MEEFLNELGIDKEPILSTNGDYVIDISDSTEFGKYYSKLDNSDLVEENEESSTVTMDNVNSQFINDDYTITLIADFNEDTYKMVIREN